MYKSICVAGIFALFVFFGLTSCGKDDSGQSVTNISKSGEFRSHNMGQNCMKCHVKGGPGKGWFNVAGTVYDSQKTNPIPNATVKLYTGVNGTGSLKYTIEGDGYGNFFTTESIDFSAGLYAVVLGKTITNYMEPKMVSGKCNDCHNQSSNRIWVN
jgi:hypothetical protein